MGYRTYMHGQVALRKGINHLAIKKELEDLCDQNQKSWHYDFHAWLDFFPTDIQIDVSDTSATPDDMEPMFRFMAKYVAEMESFDAQGDDSDDKWRVVFDGKGGYEVKYATIIYGYEPFMQFMEECGEELPPKLKEQLEQWHTARRI